MMFLDVLDYCLAKPGAWQDEPWDGDIVAKVDQKVFAFLGSPGTDGSAGGIGLKCGRDATDASEWRDRYPHAVSVSAYVGRYGWNSFSLDGTIPDEEVYEAIDASYAAIVARLPKSKRPAAPSAGD